MVYKNVYIAVCDILGFKDLIKNNDFETTKSILEKFITNIELAVTGGKAIQYDFPEGTIIVTDPSEIKLNFNLFSDTFVFWTNDGSVKSFFELLIGTANIFSSSLKYGLPLRGAITQGELLANPYQIESKFNNFENIIYGKSLIRAFELEQDQLWSGCFIDPDLAGSEEQAIRIIFEDKLHRDLYIFANVPLKSAGCRKHLTLNWVSWKEDNIIQESEIISSFTDHNKTLNDRAKTLLENTLEYYRYSMEIKEKYFRS